MNHSQNQSDSRLNLSGQVQGFAAVQATETWVWQNPELNSARMTQLTFGEPVQWSEKEGDFALVQSLRDHYCGWVAQKDLQFLTEKPALASHFSICITSVYRDPDMKSPIVATLPPDALCTPSDKKNDFYLLDGLGWVACQHLLGVNKTVDPIATARAHLGRSYVWGGRGVAGLDCSALSQLCYRHAGWSIPRDADLQKAFLKNHHQRVELCELQRGDLIFFPSHVMIAADPYTVIHANAHHMRVTIEDLQTVIVRARAELGERFSLRAYHWRTPASSSLTFDL